MAHVMRKFHKWKDGKWFRSSILLLSESHLIAFSTYNILKTTHQEPIQSEIELTIDSYLNSVTIPVANKSSMTVCLGTKYLSLQITRAVWWDSVEKLHANFVYLDSHQSSCLLVYSLFHGSKCPLSKKFKSLKIVSVDLKCCSADGDGCLCVKVSGWPEENIKQRPWQLTGNKSKTITNSQQTRLISDLIQIFVMCNITREMHRKTERQYKNPKEIR